MEEKWKIKKKIQIQCEIIIDFFKNYETYPNKKHKKRNTN